MTIHLFEGGHTSMRRTELTTREREVLSLVWQGKMNKEIAHILGINERTVKVHIQNLFTKTRTRNRASLAVFGYRLFARSNK